MVRRRLEIPGQVGGDAVYLLGEQADLAGAATPQGVVAEVDVGGGGGRWSGRGAAAVAAVTGNVVAVTTSARAHTREPRGLITTALLSRAGRAGVAG
ncbi:hypothetical protein GCM10027614_08410 [Micromonospora vulcania]